MSEPEVSSLSTTHSDSMWDRAIDAAVDIVYLLSVDGTIVDGNPRLYSILKKPKESVDGTRMVDYLVADDQSVAERMLCSIAENRRSERATRTLDGGAGHRPTFEVIESPILRDGEVIGISGIGRDITQEVVLEQKLWDTDEDSRSTLEFALRTSLGLVKGYVHTLQNEESLDADQRRRYRHIVIDEVEHLSKIVDDLLDYRRLEESSLRFEHEVTDLAESIDMVVARVKGEVDRREIEMVCTVPENLDPIHLSPEAVTRILTNLLQNAIHHTLHSGRIEVKVVDSDAYVDVSVIDNGVGIPEKEIPFVFEKFYRGDGGGASPVQGAGIGLAVVRMLVTAMGGRIWVTSAPGEGTIFRFMLPRNAGAVIPEVGMASDDSVSDLVDMSQ